MDVGAVLGEARALARLSQTGLARRSGVARSSICAYETGRRSPTVRQLAALLAACGLRAEVALTELGVELEAQIEAVLRDDAQLDHDRLGRIAASFERQGVPWAVDGATALALQGLTIKDELSVVPLFDLPLRLWLARLNVCVRDRFGELSPVSAEIARDDLERGLACGPVTGFGLWMFKLRVVDELPETSLGVLEDGRQVPVVGVLDVLREHPEWVAVVAGALARAS